MKEKLSLEKIEILLKKFESEEKDMVIELIRRENERQRKIGEKKKEEWKLLEIC